MMLFGQHESALPEKRVSQSASAHVPHSGEQQTVCPVVASTVETPDSQYPAQVALQ